MKNQILLGNTIPASLSAPVEANFNNAADAKMPVARQPQTLGNIIFCLKFSRSYIKKKKKDIP